MTVENIAHHAAEKGLECIILTPHFHKRVSDASTTLYEDSNEDIFLALREEIDCYEKRNGTVKFLLSTETDILSLDGEISLDISAAAENALDLVSPTLKKEKKNARIFAFITMNLLKIGVTYFSNDAIKNPPQRHYNTAHPKTQYQNLRFFIALFSLFFTVRVPSAHPGAPVGPLLNACRSTYPFLYSDGVFPMRFRNRVLKCFASEKPEERLAPLTDRFSRSNAFACSMRRSVI